MNKKTLYALATVAIVAIGVAMANPEKPTPAAAKSTAPDAAALRYSACQVSHRFIAERLQAPRSARFEDCDDMTVSHAGGRWQLAGYVDAQNGFGAMLRSMFTITLAQGPTATDVVWNLVDLQLQP